jgi:hypothetical protein
MIQPLEGPGQLREDRGLPQVCEPAGAEPTRGVTYGVPGTWRPRNPGTHGTYGVPGTQAFPKCVSRLVRSRPGVLRMASPEPPASPWLTEVLRG